MATSHGYGGWIGCRAVSLAASVLFGAVSSGVNASIAGDVGEVSTRASVAGRVAVEGAWVEGVDAAVASCAASGPDAGPTGPAVRVALAADFLLLIAPISLCFQSLFDR